MSNAQPFNPIAILSAELSLPAVNVASVVRMLSEGSTVPFIARYRKEMTGDMDEVQIRTIQERGNYLNELEDRRQVILTSIEEQGKLTDELKGKIVSCSTKSALEDLYLPYKPKRRTKATIAREKGLEPLADMILGQIADGDPLQAAEAFVDAEKGVDNVEAALQGARDIVAEATSENAEIRQFLRDLFMSEALLSSEVVKEKKEAKTKFQQYYEFSELVKNIPSHRFLAIRRGEQEGVLTMRIEIDGERALPVMQQKMNMQTSSPFAGQMQAAVSDAYQRLLKPSIETDVRVELKNRSDESAVDVFASNLRSLMMSAPLGTKSLIGIDPGLRTGCKCVAVNETGKYMDSTTIYLVKGENAMEKAKETLKAFIERHDPYCIAVGNGTAGRETEAFTRKLLKDNDNTHIHVIPVSESGASVYSASDVAREEFPNLDVTIRGAISIARRLQDPLAELVKIDPKSIGVGQYQHDVFQPLLQRKLHEVVESCVNNVGVELNTASPSLLSYVSGIGPSLAKKIVAHREQYGVFSGRKHLLDVPGMGPKTFEQAAGFLRVRYSQHPLDSSAVHPERYELVDTMAKDIGVDNVGDLIGNKELIEKIDISKYISDDVGEPTLKDILAELRKPGRDPRDTFEPPKFLDDVMTIEDLKPGMEIEGIVTNVTAFGAFVDVGVHQDGLVHISEISDRFVSDPAEVVKTGQKLKVRVLDVEVDRKRISLSAKKEAAPRQQQPQQPRRDDRRPQQRNNDRRGPRPGRNDQRRDNRNQQQQPRKDEKKFGYNPFADLLKKK